MRGGLNIWNTTEGNDGTRRLVRLIKQIPGSSFNLVLVDGHEKFSEEKISFTVNENLCVYREAQRNLVLTTRVIYKLRMEDNSSRAILFVGKDGQVSNSRLIPIPIQ